MSVDIDWSLLDAQVSAQLVATLNDLLSRTALPSYLGPLTVLDFMFGEAPPTVELVDITNVNPDFLQSDEEHEEETKSEHLANARKSARSDGETTVESTDDVQLRMRTQYAGNLQIELATTLLVNYPSPLFMSLPLRLNLTALDFAADWIIAVQPSLRRMHLTMTAAPELSEEHVPNSFSSARPGPAASILRDLRCDPSEVGEADKHVLRNVGKVEKFVLELVRGLLESEIVWPNFITVDY